jgi:hypothetical protein
MKLTIIILVLTFTLVFLSYVAILCIFSIQMYKELGFEFGFHWLALHK